MKTQSKVAIVTGGLGGIGRSTALTLARAGYHVLVSDIIEPHAVDLESLRVNGDIVYAQSDVSQETDVSALVAEAVKHWARLDVMVANAGIAGMGDAVTTSAQHWQSVMDTNLNGVFYCIKHAAAQMLLNGGGSIVTVASVMGLVGASRATPYAASKGAVVNMTRAAALDYAKDHIRINAVCPGHLERPTARGGKEARKADDRDLLARYPMGRLGKVDEVAKAIAFLASDDASFITGTMLAVDGGYSAM